MDKCINTPLDDDMIKALNAGDYVYLTGTVYVARDAAHKRMYETIRTMESMESVSGGSGLPFDIRNSVIYYMGPTPARDGQVIGSAGPTTSGRMDKYTPLLLDMGLKGMIGKGNRSREVVESMKKNVAVYFAAVGGAGALLSRRVTASEVIAYGDLGTEAVRRLEVVDFPMVVAIDCKGRNVYEDVYEDVYERV